MFTGEAPPSEPQAPAPRRATPAASVADAGAGTPQQPDEAADQIAAAPDADVADAATPER
jgi:hypothetical protein